MNACALRRPAAACLLMAATFALCRPGTACAAPAAPSDVPPNHWARASVLSVVRRGVMSAPNGRFAGATNVSRREMAVTMARYARALEAGKWTTADAVPKRKPRPGTVADDHKPITRYDLADAMDRLALYGARGLPRATGKVYGKSEALLPVNLAGVAKTDPAYSSLAYLVKNRMLRQNSPLLKPSKQAVTQSEAAEAIARVFIGVNDRLTDEPALSPDLGPMPEHDHGDAPAGRQRTAPNRPPARPGARA